MSNEILRDHPVKAKRYPGSRRTLADACVDHRDGEQWKPILGYPGYHVSDHGRVKSHRSRNGRGSPVVDDARLIFGEVHRSGHRYVYLFDGTGKAKFGVHCLVLEAFVSKRPPGMFACHNDGDPSNNHLNNLRWASPRENMADMVRHKAHPCQKLTEADVRHIWSLLVAGEPALHVAKRLGIPYATVASIKLGKTWGHLTATLEGRPPGRNDESLEGEEWKPLPGYEGYEISNLKRLRSVRGKAPRIVNHSIRNGRPYFLVRQGCRYALISVSRAVEIAENGIDDQWKPRGPRPRQR